MHGDVLLDRFGQFGEAAEDAGALVVVRHGDGVSALHRQARLGVIERDATTVYVVAGRLADHSKMLEGLATSSRDFH